MLLSSALDGIGGTGGTGEPSAYSGENTTSPPLIRLSLQYGDWRKGCSPLGNVAESCRVMPLRNRELRGSFETMNELDTRARAREVPEIVEDGSSEHVDSAREGARGGTFKSKVKGS